MCQYNKLLKLYDFTDITGARAASFAEPGIPKRGVPEFRVPLSGTTAEPRAVCACSGFPVPAVGRNPDARLKKFLLNGANGYIRFISHKADGGHNRGAIRRSDGRYAKNKRR